MRKTLFVALVLMLVTIACGGGNAVPTLAPTLDLNGGEGASPRVTVTPATQVPPTWTPAPSPLPPTAPPPPPTQQTYVVQPGDTLAEIAAQFGVTLQALADANGIDNVDVIEVGQQLVIPAP